MANRLFSSNSKNFGSFGRNLRLVIQDQAILPQGRNYSQGWKRRNVYVEQVIYGGHTGERQAPTVWPDPSLGCLGAKDTRFNLPGNVGLESVSKESSPPEKPTQEEIQADKKKLESEIAFWHDLCDSPTNHQRQLITLNQHIQFEKIHKEKMAAGERAVKREKMDLECIPNSCPTLLRRDMCLMFGSSSLANGPLTVITFCTRTKNDMSCWSPEIEEERDELVEFFINTAKELCGQLRTRAQWADFIDPCSGRPFYGKFTNLTFFETDERYRHLGFKINDLGCCKVISHHKWGTHSFVGSIFTTAPHDSEYLQIILANYNNEQKPI